MDYNRLLYGLNGLTEAEFLKKVEETLGRVLPVESAYRPTKPHTVGLYVGKKWYCVEFRKEICDGKTAVERLDCSILQNRLLAPVLGIEDPRTDKKNRLRRRYSRDRVFGGALPSWRECGNRNVSHFYGRTDGDCGRRRNYAAEIDLV